MIVFVDSSAFVALLDASDPAHARAEGALGSLREDGAALLTSSFVVHESSALIQRRLGMEAVRGFHEDALHDVELIWLDRTLYDRAVATMLAAGRRRVSLTDWTSFELMRSRGIADAFTFDEDFVAQGFRVIPGAV